MEQIAPSRNEHHGVLKPIENGIGIRERPKTMLSPEMKRTKTLSSDIPVVAYPASIPVPSKRVIEDLYKASLQEGCGESTEGNSNENNHYNDQKHLAPAGILSFQNILLPSIGIQEEKAIKQVQAKVQRDAPEYKFVMENCRRLVRKSIRSAMNEVKSSRSMRCRRQEERKQKQIAEAKLAREIKQRERQEEKDRIAQERVQTKETLRLEKRRNLAREHPKNQELWKEIVYLTSSFSRLELEFCSLVDVAVEMRRLKADLENRTEENSSSSGAIILRAEKNPLQIETEEKTKEIISTSNSIQKGLGMVMQLTAESDKARRELYSKYKTDHVFRGYRSVHNPKNLIRFLSQSQDDH